MEDGISNSRHDLTLLPQDWCHGNQTALDGLVPLICAGPHRLAPASFNSRQITAPDSCRSGTASKHTIQRR